MHNSLCMKSFMKSSVSWNTIFFCVISLYAINITGCRLRSSTWIYICFADLWMTSKSKSCRKRLIGLIFELRSALSIVFWSALQSVNFFFTLVFFLNYIYIYILHIRKFFTLNLFRIFIHKRLIKQNLNITSICRLYF